MICGIALFFLFFIFPFDKNIIFIKNKPLNSTNSNIYKTLKNETKRKLEYDYDQITIYVESKCLLSYLETQEDINQNNKEIIKKSIEKAKNTLEKLIKVENRLDKISFEGLDFGNGFTGCYDMNLISNGINADLVIFMRGPTTESNMKSYGKTNIMKYYNGNTDNRPIIATFIYNFFDFPNDENYTFQLISTLILHHFTHILGLKNDILKRKGIINDKKVIIRNNQTEVTKPVVVSSRVIERAKNYFNCPNLTYLEINDEGNDICEETFHWNARVLLGEYMISNIYYPEQIISEFTLSLMEDLGYYQVYYYTGGLMRYGKNKGCSFIYNDCVNFIIKNDDEEEEYTLSSSFLNEFCSFNDKKIGTCSSGRLSMGYCFNINPSDAINDYKRNINIYGKGYGLKFVEYCPISYEIETYSTDDNKKDEKYNGNCKIGNKDYGSFLKYITGSNYKYNSFSEIIEENYSEISFCALSSILKKNERKKDSNRNINGLIRPTCYEMFCSDTSLTIKINKEYIVCPREGGIIKVESNYTDYEGYLYCPDYNLICTGTKVCNNMFDCVEKRSEINYNTYNYTYSNNNITIFPNIYKESSIKEVPIEGYELSNNGECPQNCRQCISNNQCIICRNSYDYYIGTKENDTNPINCSNSIKNEGYYFTDKYIPGKKFYFRCIDNCYKCEEETKDICKQCSPYHIIEDGKCKERIPGCENYNTTNPKEMEDNGGALSYTECENCNNSANFFCVNMNKKECIEIKDYNKSIYFDMEDKPFPCVKKCEDEFQNCLTCNKSSCILCNQTHHLINNRGNCVEIIDFCEEQDLDIDYKKCNKCKQNDNYYCIDDDRTQCHKINDINHFYKIEPDNIYSCRGKCNKIPKCLECSSENICTKCEDGFFVYQGHCIENITGCIDNIYDGINKECNECNKNDDYYCINKDKTICHKISSDNIRSFYPISNIDYPCYNSCDSLVDNCFRCNKTHCHECTEKYIINDNLTFCFLRPFNIPDNDNCTVRIHDYNVSIYQLDIWDFVDYYWEKNIPYIKVVDHYIGNNFTVTVYINSDCTEELLNQKYFKIDSNYLQETMIKESKIEGMKILFSIFINYNFKNHFRYHDLESRFLNPSKRCPLCLDMNYTITNYFYNSINKILGPIVVKLLVSEKIDIIEKDSKIFNDICNNVTFYGIDLPLKKRLKHLYLHKYSEPILCNAENCTIEEYNYDELTSTCKCNYGNSFEDILAGEKFEFVHYEGEEVKSNDFADSFGIIKCVSNGFHLKNIKSNIGFFLCIIAVVAQIILYIYYTFYSKPIINIIKNTYNPPKKSSLLLITDWARNLRNLNNLNEHEIYVQPRDDAEDQLLEEEKSYNNEDIFNTSSVSIDTNVGGGNIKKGPDKLILKEKVDNKKVLILLGKNKNKNRDKDRDQLITEDLKSDSDIIPLQEGKDSKLNFCKIYWSVVSLKQHIINYFSNINCCKITESYIPIPIRAIRSIFIFILSFVFNILFLNHTYYENKFEYFNEKYTFIHSEVEEQKIPISQKINYAISNTFVKALLSFLLLIIVQFLIGIIFFSIRNNVIKTKRKNNLDGIQDLVLKTRLKYLIFFIINIALMVVFFLSITGFGGAYGGGFVDYFVAGIISLIFLEIFPFIWSLVIALLRYIGFKKKNKILFKISDFFMF